MFGRFICLYYLATKLRDMKSKEESKLESFRNAIELPIMKRIAKAIDKESAKGGYILDYKIKQRENQKDKNFEYLNNSVYHTLVLLGYNVRINFIHKTSSNKKHYIIVIDWHDKVTFKDTDE